MSINKEMQQIMGVTEDELQDFLKTSGPMAIYHYDVDNDILYFFNVQEEDYDIDEEYQYLFGTIDKFPSGFNSLTLEIINESKESEIVESINNIKNSLENKGQYVFEDGIKEPDENMFIENVLNLNEDLMFMIYPGTQNLSNTYLRALYTKHPLIEDLEVQVELDSPMECTIGIKGDEQSLKRVYSILRGYYTQNLINIR